MSPASLPAALRALWRIARQQGVPGLYRAYRKFASRNLAYRRWVRRNDTLTERDLVAIDRHIAAFSHRPLISVLMPTYNTPERWLRRAIDSVRAQRYPHWELCVADDASTQPHILALLQEYQGLDARIRVVLRDSNGHISAASNSALALCSGEFIALLDHDDELPPHALYLVAAALDENPQLDMIYSDEDKIDARGRRFGPYFKPDWNPDLLTSQNLVSHLGVYRTQVVREAGGFRPGFEGSQDWDLALRVAERVPAAHIRHIPHVLYHWRAISGSTAIAPGEKHYVMSASYRVVQDHLQRTGRNATAMPAFGSFVRVKYQLPAEPPLVSIILMGNGQPDDMLRCLQQLQGATDYPHIETVICGQPGTTDGLVPAAGRKLVPVADNLAATLNLAAGAAEGAVLCFLDAALIPCDPDWLEELAVQALRPEIGAAGPMLLDAAGAVWSAGMIFGQTQESVAIPLYRGCPSNETGDAGRAALVQNTSVLPPFCMAMRKQAFLQVAGFDEAAFPRYLGGFDLCLKLVQAGLRNLWTPNARLQFVRNPADGQADARYAASEVTRFRERRSGVIGHDPAWNSNLVVKDGWPCFRDRIPGTEPWQTASVNPDLGAGTAPSGDAGHPSSRVRKR